MSLLSRLLCWPYTRLENNLYPPHPNAERRQYYQDLDIYPITDSYFVSEYTPHITSRMVLHHPSGQKLISICLGPEDADFADQQYLRRVEGAMLNWTKEYEGVLPAIQAAIGLPKNTISVSIAERKFSCGDEPHEFIYDNPKPRDTFLTYQMLRDGFQITHFNHVREVSVPAGSVFFVQSNGKDYELEKSDVTMSIRSTACENGYRWVRSVVEEKAMKWPSRSYLIEPTTSKLQDQIQKIIQGYPTTLAPFKPDILNQAVSTKLVDLAPGYPALAIKLAEPHAVLANPDSLEMIQGRLLAWFGDVAPVQTELMANPLMRNRVAVRFALTNFKLNQEGFLASEFSPGSFWSYQKLSENLEATYYNENGLEYLAGLSYYPELGGYPRLIENDRALIYLALASAEPYPKPYPKPKRGMMVPKKYGRYCSKVNRRVVVEADPNFGVGRHFDFDHLGMQFFHVDCEECLRDFLDGEGTHMMRIVVKNADGSVTWQLGSRERDTVVKEEDKEEKKNN